ncbi:TMEM165/GDT1 family protein [Catenovulum sp. 2E275]|uniref:TMEM165/GDT1 family protein n=1 Tax=Catenovulum sp. 2E275 TaxID=2980497 RepID=UPI0021D0079A|nr:TMEM165/GDT1 family protein [Catenovulum sp. 2E275]MCU4675172.1 TMEM165/GDT1 family protein [Catenovulum sp. 2E275]
MEALFTSTLSVAIAEMGDKTQLLSLLLAAKFRNKLAIVMGILVATLINHAVSAWFGVWLAKFLQDGWGVWLLGGSFIAVGLWLLIPDKDEETDNRFDKYGAFVVSAILFFVAEIGDKTQIATVLLGAQFQSTLMVTIGTTVGMLLANVPVIYAGDKLMKKIPLNLTRLIAAAIFIIVGIVSILV